MASTALTNAVSGAGAGASAPPTPQGTTPALGGGISPATMGAAAPNWNLNNPGQQASTATAPVPSPQPLSFNTSTFGTSFTNPYPASVTTPPPVSPTQSTFTAKAAQDQGQAIQDQINKLTQPSAAPQLTLGFGGVTNPPPSSLQQTMSYLQQRMAQDQANGYAPSDGLNLRSGVQEQSLNGNYSQNNNNPQNSSSNPPPPGTPLDANGQPLPTVDQQAIQQQQALADANLSTFQNQLNASKTQYDSAMNNQITAIQSQYANMQALQQQANSASLLAAKMLGERAGSPQSVAGLVSDQQFKNTIALSNLNNAESKALSDAQEALASKDIDLASDLYDKARQTSLDKQDIVSKMQDETQKQQTLLNDQLTYANNQIKDAQDQKSAALDYMTKNADAMASQLVSVGPDGKLTAPDPSAVSAAAQAAGMSPEQAALLQGSVNKLVSSDDIQGLNIQKSLWDIKTQGFNADSQEFQALQDKGELPPGVTTPTQFSQYLLDQKAAAAEKAKVIESNDPNIALTPSEAIAYGVPPGTTRGQAASMVTTQLPTAAANRLDTLNDNFKSSQAYKDYETVVTRQNDAQEIAAQQSKEQGLTGQGAADMSLMMDYIKSNTPNQRITSYEMQNLQQVVNSGLQNAGIKLDRLTTPTGFLSDDARQALQSQIDIQSAGAKASYDTARAELVRDVNNNVKQGSGDLLATDLQAPASIAKTQASQPWSSSQDVQNFLNSQPKGSDAEKVLQYMNTNNNPATRQPFTPQDMWSYFNPSGSSGGGNVGSDTHAAAPVASQDGVDAYVSPSGEAVSSPTTLLQGMQTVTDDFAPQFKQFADNCALFARQFVPNIPSGADSIAGRIQGIKEAEAGGYGGTDMSKVQVGDAIHTSEGNVGHTAIVIGENGNNLILEEANYKNGQITVGRQISKDDPKILGYIQPTDNTVAPSEGEGDNEAIADQTTNVLPDDQLQSILAANKSLYS